MWLVTNDKSLARGSDGSKQKLLQVFEALQLNDFAPSSLQGRKQTCQTPVIFFVISLLAKPHEEEG